MKTAIRLGPQLHTYGVRSASGTYLITRHESGGRQAPSHPHTWLPYITPNRVRLTHEIS